MEDSLGRSILACVVNYGESETRKYNIKGKIFTLATKNAGT